MEAYRDRALFESVRQRIMEDSRIAGQSITVTANNGYVQLSGSVDTEENMQRVIEITRGVMGVRGVESRLDVQESDN